MSLVHFNITIWKIASVIRSSEQLCIFLKLAWHVNFRLERNRYFQDGNWTMKLNPDLACFLTPSTKGLIFNVVIALWWPILEFHEQKADSWEITGIPNKEFFLLPSDWLHFPNKCLHVLTFCDLYSRRRRDGMRKISKMDFELLLSDRKLLS